MTENTRNDNVMLKHDKYSLYLSVIAIILSIVLPIGSFLYFQQIQAEQRLKSKALQVSGEHIQVVQGQATTEQFKVYIENTGDVTVKDIQLKIQYPNKKIKDSNNEVVYDINPPQKPESIALGDLVNIYKFSDSISPKEKWEIPVMKNTESKFEPIVWIKTEVSNTPVSWTEADYTEFVSDGPH